MRLFKKICTIFLVLLVQYSSAQSTQAFTDPDAEFKKAKELFIQHKYSLAFPMFKQIYFYEDAEHSNIPEHSKAEAKYYYILSGLYMDDATFLPLATSFVELEEYPARVQMMYYYLGEYYFRKSYFFDAIECYKKTNIDNLSNSEIDMMKFHKAYAYFTLQQFNEAKPLFNAIRQIATSPNYFDANYYYGFISFYDTKYSEAQKAFLVVEKESAYEKLVPFYLAEIYYFEGDREKALSYAEKKINEGGQFYETDLKQLAGHIWFEKKEYDKALPYLEAYVNKMTKVRREDLYELSFCYYSNKNWNKSIEGFKQLGGKEDSLAQNSMYLLADAYLKVNDKPNARNAFLFCVSNSSNAIQKEISHFSYAKLSYELGYLDIASKELNSFVTAYPTSIYLQEAKELQVNVLANTSNYKEALELYGSLATKNEATKKVYPKILYGRAVEMVNDKHIDIADSLLSNLINAAYNTTYLQLTYFWKGEIAYQNNNLDAGIYYLSAYLKMPMINGEVNEKNAKYNLAYCYYRKENYSNALQNFEQVANAATSTSSATEQDAYLRTGDCNFMMKNIIAASKIYDNVIAQNLRSADFALYQKAIIAGVSGKMNDKISLLQSLPKQYPNSNLYAEACMETAVTYLSAEQYANAINSLNQIIAIKGNPSPFLPQAYLKSGVAYFNLDNKDEALKSFNPLFEKYPNSQESDEAVEYVRNIFIAKQQPDNFIALMKKYGKPITYTEEDSLTYRSAELRWQARDTVNTKKGIQEYLTKFPDGRYALDANALMASVFYAQKNPQAALTYYVLLADKGVNKYAEQSALQAARIYYFNLSDFANAAKYFSQTKQIAVLQENKIEAMRGLLRCQYKLQQWSLAEPNARELLQEKTIATDDKMMCNLIIGKNLQSNNKSEEAAKAYKQVVDLGKSEFSAEAQYRIAEILFTNEKWAAAEKAAFDLIKKFGSYEFWVTKSYLLLGDIYFKQNDLFNAEATFKSVADNAKIADLKAEAADKLALVIAEKSKVNKVD